jgi:hypothetical protein
MRAGALPGETVVARPGHLLVLVLPAQQQRTDGVLLTTSSRTACCASSCRSGACFGTAALQTAKKTSLAVSRANERFQTQNTLVTLTISRLCSERSTQSRRVDDTRSQSLREKSVSFASAFTLTIPLPTCDLLSMIIPHRARGASAPLPWRQKRLHTPHETFVAAGRKSVSIPSGRRPGKESLFGSVRSISAGFSGPPSEKRKR